MYTTTNLIHAVDVSNGHYKYHGLINALTFPKHRPYSTEKRTLTLSFLWATTQMTCNITNFTSFKIPHNHLQKMLEVDNIFDVMFRKL